MKKVKIENSATEYCEGKSIHLTALLEYAYKIEFAAKPNYDEIRFLLKKVLLDMNQIPKVPFIWR